MIALVRPEQRSLRSVVTGEGNSSPDADFGTSPNVPSTLSSRKANVARGGAGTAGNLTPAPTRPSLLRAGGQHRTGRPSVSDAANFTTLNPVLCWPSVVHVDFITTKEVLSRISYMPTSAAEGSTGTADTTTVPQQNRLLNIHREADPAMPNTMHPLEKWLLNRPTIRRHVLSAFLEDDNLSELERTALEELGMSDAEIEDYRANQLAGQSLERNGFTRLTRDRFMDAGFQLSLVETTHTTNIIQLRPNQQSAG